MNDDRTARIRGLNDQLRLGLLRPGRNRVVMTSSVAALGSAAVAAVLQKVAAFAAFDTGNDPYGEHDFGAFDHDGERFNFKIDYYDPQLEFGSEHPEDEAQTVRVLTIMLAVDY